MSIDTGTVTTGQRAARRALGVFLRAMRDRATPPAARPGMRHAPRRAPGLRREEVAAAAGISITWYTWLEQGRPVGVSSNTLTAIAQALRLEDAERAHLRTLAEAASAPEPARAIRRRELTASLRALVDGLAPHAAYAINGWWDVLHANTAATELLGDFTRTPGTTDNVMRRLFLDPSWRERYTTWNTVAESAVAQYRTVSGYYIGDPAWELFVSTLVEESAIFARMWSQHHLARPSASIVGVRKIDGTTGMFHHASVSPDTEHCDVRVVVYIPVHPTMERPQHTAERTSATLHTQHTLANSTHT